MHSNATEWPAEDKYLATAPWTDAQILAPPAQWADLPADLFTAGVRGFDPTGRPNSWPMRLAKVHWAVLLPGLPAGDYTLRSRTIDANGRAQPLPRPFRKSGHSAIESVRIVVKG